MTESPIDQPPGEPDGNEQPTLMKRVIRGSFWTLGGHALEQIIRLGSNLIVTRLLFPEAFGTVALVFTFTSGLDMLSDIGIGPNVIQSKRGDDPKFLDTAWTVSIIRGVFLWLMSCLIAWPVATFYKVPTLMLLMPVVGLSMVIQGFTSTKMIVANRTLELKKITVIDISCRLVGVVLMVLAAWVANVTKAPQDVAVWALVVGTLAGALLRTLMSHYYLAGHSNRFHWDATALQELQRFGRWIFVSTLLTFFALQGSNLVIPRFLGVGFLGIFSVANNLSRMANEVLNIVSMRVLYPSYAELVRERPERLYPALRRSRLAMNAMNWGISLFFIFFGKALVGIMYDNRYADAGWVLQILSLGSLVTMLGLTYLNVLMAQGKTFIMSMLMGVQVFVQFASMFAGYYFGGKYGLIVGIAGMGWVLYPIQAFFLARLKIWQPEIDLPAIGVASGIAMLMLFNYI